MQPRSLHFRVRDISSRIPKYVPLLLHRRRTPTPRGTQRERGDTLPCAVPVPDLLQLLPPELDLSPMNNAGAPPENLVRGVRNFKPFLPDGCELLGKENLEITTTGPVDAGGIADILIGEKNGTTVAIKSYRQYASSSPLTTYLVSYKYYPNMLCLPDVIGRGCLRRH
jgi:hypothetical protein